jgi:hypothetical protein
MLDPKYEFIKSHNQKVLETAITGQKLKGPRPKKGSSIAGQVMFSFGRIFTGIGNFLLTRGKAKQTT